MKTTQIDPKEYESYIERWHNGEFPGKNAHEVLGISWEAFAAWVECKMRTAVRSEE